MSKKNNSAKKLADIVIEGIQEKKGIEIVRLDLTGLLHSVADYYIICHGNNKPQVEAIADSVMRHVDSKTGEDPWQKEGIENAEWILLDYVDVVVHIFQKERREFYKLENLWADAGIKRIADEKPAEIN
jgi:ribosome-associated protein